MIDRLIESGAATLEVLADMTPEQLLEIPSVGPELVERIQAAVSQCYTHLERTVGAVPAARKTRTAPPEADGSDPGTAPAASKAPPVLPGVPEAGAGASSDDEDGDAEMDLAMAELERFGKMNRYTVPSQEAGDQQVGPEAGIARDRQARAAERGRRGWGRPPCPHCRAARRTTIRINELARELEVPNREIVALLPGLGIHEPKSHSSSLDDRTAAKIRDKIRGRKQDEKPAAAQELDLPRPEASEDRAGPNERPAPPVRPLRSRAPPFP